MEWRNHLNLIRSLFSEFGEITSENLRRAREFLGDGWQIATATTRDMESARSVNVTVRIQELSPADFRRFFRIQADILRRMDHTLTVFNTGWRAGLQERDWQTLTLFTRTEIRFRLDRKGSAKIPFVLGLVLAGLFAIGIVVRGVSVISEDRVLITAMERGYQLPIPRPKRAEGRPPPLVDTIETITKLLLVGFGIYVITQLGVLEKVREKIKEKP